LLIFARIKKSRVDARERTSFYDDNIIFESDSHCDIALHSDIALSTFLSSSVAAQLAESFALHTIQLLAQLDCFSVASPRAIRCCCRILIEIELKFTSIDLSSLLHIYSLLVDLTLAAIAFLCCLAWKSGTRWCFFFPLLSAAAGTIEMCVHSQLIVGN
jgi:hypothetical protein